MNKIAAGKSLPGWLKACFLLFIACCLPAHGGEGYDWKQDWALDENFEITIDTEGYQFPSSIAFVPEPGPGPKDPLYFVTELKGKIKVVTNDRTVYTFAEDFFVLKTSGELPSFAGEVGLAGICLNPKQGYVFVTFAYQDSNKILRNNIMRFESEPGTFSVKPKSSVAFTDIFSRQPSAPSHQIGSCQVYDDHLYVSVGDAFDLGYSSGLGSKKSQDMNSLVGKVLRMTLDGKPARDNPYYVDDNVMDARNYVWAGGLRNPFGLKVVDGRVFVADNGGNVDRFLEVERGGNYLWDGNDWSIATNASAVFFPANGVAQLDYDPGTNKIFPGEFSGKFYLTLCGDPDTNPREEKGRGIVMLDYDFREKKMASPPSYFLKYEGSVFQVIAGIAIGSDGLYLVPALPLGDGRSAVLKVSYSPGSSPVNKLGDDLTAGELLESHGCYGCHVVGGIGWGAAGPNLEQGPLIARIKERLNTDEYIGQSNELDKLDFEPFMSYREARKEVLDSQGMDKVRLWVIYHLLEPRFDNPYSLMPNTGLTKNEAIVLTDFLLDTDTGPGTKIRKSLSQTMSHFIPHIRYRHIVYSFILGLSLSLVIVLAFIGIRRKR